MSIKSTVLFASLFIVLSSQSNIVRANIDDEVGAAESMKSSLRPLFDLDQNKVPLSEFEAESPMPKLLMKDYTLITQEALDKEMISKLKGASVLLTEFQNEIVDYQFAKRIGFSPNETKKEESWLQIIEKKLENLASKFPSAFYGEYGYRMLD